MIKFLDLQKVNQQYATLLKKAAADVIDSGWFLNGEHVGKYESELSAYLNAKNVVSCANGLDGLRLILRGYKEMGIITEKDEVIVPANTFIASILSITDNNLKPVLVDPDIDTFNMDLAGVESKITEKTRAIMLVHLYGRICWNEELKGLAKKYNLLIIEDNAQAIGARWANGKKSGTLGNSAGLSFYPGKNLGALGDSGAVLTDDDTLGSIIRSLANYGSQTKYYCDYKGLNSRMDEIQAAFLRVKLKYLDFENTQRRNIASIYLKNIENDDIILPAIEGMLPESHVWHLFVIRSKRRDELQRYLSEEGIQTLIHYPVPPHKQKCYFEMRDMSFPVTEQLANEALSLPISAVMDFNEVERVVEIINKF